MYSNDDDVKFQAKIENEKNVTPEDIIKEADVIWDKIKSKKIKFGDQDAAEKCMEL